MKNKKTRRLKAIGFSSLALLMGIAGTLAFAPIGASPTPRALANASAATTANTNAVEKVIKYAPSPLGLDPENDPILYTTESGLEIKFGGLNYETSLPSNGALKGYPYFTMGTYNGYAVNWVIIGYATNIDPMVQFGVDKLISYFQTYFHNYKNSSYFFEHQHESYTPAGTTINADIKNKAYIHDYNISPVANSEITSGCVLALSECTLGTSAYSPISSTSSNYEGSTLQSAMNTLYSSLNLTTSQQNMIVAQTLTNAYSTYQGTGTVADYYKSSTSSNQKIFPLAGPSGSNSYFTNQSFVHNRYLTSNNLRIAYAIGTTTATRWWMRGSDGWSYDIYFANMSGAAVMSDATYDGNDRHDVNSDAIFGVRPACVIKLS